MSDEHHYFTSSALYWRTDADLFKCLRAQYDADRRSGYTVRGCNVFKVPLPPDADYQIRDYRPLVEGVEFIDYVEYPKRKEKKSR